ncbi:1701_t:CDS:2 [Scutellospora calospora]|uniref:1701_t:CDS:1 n=1 Tax=Scutellospora calospora TaxID=85575 RepID=A0ACA9LQE8_9GLOM|nr:1701_t:CDS:2 [Scutellospora calospora]
MDRSKYPTVEALGVDVTNAGKKVIVGGWLHDEEVSISLPNIFNPEYDLVLGSTWLTRLGNRIDGCNRRYWEYNEKKKIYYARNSIDILSPSLYTFYELLFPKFFAINSDGEFLKKIDGKISRKLTLEEKDSKFIREKATAPLGLAVILLIFTSNIKDNIHLNNKKSIMILTEVLVDRYNSTLPNYILLSNNWFYGRKYDDDELQTYIPEIRVIVSVNKRDIHDFYKILPEKSKDSSTSNLDTSSNSDTSNSDSSNSSISSSEIEATHAHKTRAVKKCPIRKRKVKGKAYCKAIMSLSGAMSCILFQRNSSSSLNPRIGDQISPLMGETFVLSSPPIRILPIRMEEIENTATQQVKSNLRLSSVLSPTSRPLETTHILNLQTYHPLQFSKKRSNEGMDVNSSSPKKKAKKAVRREDSPILKKLIKKLSAPIPQQSSSGSIISLQTFPDIDISSVNFRELDNKIINAEDGNKKTILEVIHAYYYFGKGEDMFNSLVNNKIREHFSDQDKVSEANLRKRKERVIKIFKLFDRVGGEGKIYCIKSFSASTILRLGMDDIDYVKAKVLKASQ